MRKILLSLLLTLSLVGCGKDKNTIVVGTIAGPETELMQSAKAVAKKRYQLDVEIKTFNDYTIPNIALDDGSLDANVYQHLPYLEASNKARNTHLESIGKTFIYPMAVYSKKIKSLSQLQDHALVAIPNDPSNEARALLLLQKAKLIKLNKGFDATVFNITDNPKKLKIKPLEAAELPRILDDVSIAVINTNYAKAANLNPKKDGLFVEDKNSPYANLIVVKAKDKNKPQLKKLVKALQSQEVKDKAKQLFGDMAIPAW